MLGTARSAIAEADGVVLDYLVLVNPDTFEELAPGVTGRGLLAAAAWVGTTRLIDNMEVELR